MIRTIDRKSKYISLIIGLMLIISAFTSVSDASDDETSSFYIHPLLPKNQIDKNVSYFDLKMEPKDKQQLNVKIYNEKDHDIRVSVSAINASTNSNGIIDYTTKGIQDQSMKHPFECIAEVKDYTVTVPALGSTIATTQVEMPKEKYDGIILGGLNFTEIPDPSDENESDDNNIAIKNKISYVVAVRLSETDKAVEPEFNLFDVKAEDVDYTPTLTHYIRNGKATLKTKMKMAINIQDDSGKSVYTETAEDMSVAPNSVLPYAMKLEKGALKAGSYTSTVKMTYLDDSKIEQSQVMKLPFNVTKEEVSKIEENIPEKSQLPLWAKLLIPLVVLLTLAVIVMAIVISKKKVK